MGVFRLELVETVRVDVPEPVRAAGAKLAVVQVGSPVTLRFTAPANPPEGVTVTEYVVLAPRATVRELGETPMEKSPPPAAVTTNVTVVVWIRLPLVAVIVKG